MKTRVRYSLLFLLLAAPMVRAEMDADRAFAAARDAYERQQFEEAAAHYESILSNGFASAELHFNLGNTRYRLGDTGRAVAEYRRALYLRPRDPDLRANLAIAQQQAGALSATEPAWMQVLGRVSRTEWRSIALVAYWLTSWIGVAYFLAGRPAVLRRAALVTLAAALLALAGLQRWRLLDSHPEAVVTRAGAQALFAPMENAQPHFALPPGSLVRVREHSGSWIKVEAGRQEGWVPDLYCEQLSPP